MMEIPLESERQVHGAQRIPQHEFDRFESLMLPWL